MDVDCERDGKNVRPVESSRHPVGGDRLKISPPSGGRG